MITLTPDGDAVRDTEPGFYTIQLGTPLTGTETVTVTGGGQTFHTFDLTSTGPDSGIEIKYALEQITLTASNNVSDVEIALERIIQQ